MKNNKSPGTDNVRAETLKAVSNYISGPITHIDKNLWCGEPLNCINKIAIRRKTFDWQKSYLTSREQIGQKNIIRCPEKIEYGDPQETVLGPILFCICVNFISMFGENY